jgi:hypothetical protein
LDKTLPSTKPNSGSGMGLCPQNSWETDLIIEVEYFSKAGDQIENREAQ